MEKSDNLLEYTRKLANEPSSDDVFSELDKVISESETDTSDQEIKDYKESLGGKTEGEKFQEEFENKQIKTVDDMLALADAMPDPKGFERIKEIAGGLFDIDNNIAGAKSAVKGVGKAVEDLANGVYDLANFAEDFFAKRGMGDGKWLSEQHKFNWIETPKNGADLFTFNVARFLLPFGAISRGIRAAGLIGKTAATADIVGTGAYTGLTADPEDKRLSDLLESTPELAPIIPDILTSKPDDTKMQSRLKNTAEAMLMGGAAHGVAEIVGKIGNMYKGKRVVEEAKKVATTTLNEVDEQVKILGELSVETGLNKSDDAAKAMLDKMSKAKVKAEELAQPTAKATEEVNKALVKDADAYIEGIDTTILQRAEATQAKNSEELFQAFDMSDDPVFKKLHEDFKGGVISLDEADKAANLILKDTKKVEKLLNRSPRTPITGEEYVAIAKLNSAAYEEVLANIPKSLEFTTDLEKLKFDEAFARFRLLSEKMLGGSSEAGRLMRYRQEIWKSKKGLDVQMSYMRELSKLGGNDRDMIAKYMLAAKEMGASTQELSQAVAKGRLSKLSDSFYSLFINGALYSTNTFMVNALSHPMTAAFHVGETTLGAMIPGSGIYMRELPAIFDGYAASIMDAIKVGTRVLIKGEVPAGYASKFDIRKPLFSEHEGLLGLVTKPLGYLAEVPTRGMMAVDTGSKIVQQRARMHQLAMRSVVSSGAKGTQAKQMYKNILNNPPAELDLASRRFAQGQTFTENNYSQLIFGQAGQAAQQLASAFPGGRVLVPFTQTATNIASYTAERTPFAILSPKVRQMWAAGGATRGEMISRIGVGTGVLSLGAYFLHKGIVRVKSKDWMGEKALDTGADFNAMNINGEWIPFDKLAPAAQLLLMGAEIADLQRHFDEDNDSDFGRLAFNASAIVATNLLPKYVTESMADFLDGIGKFAEGNTKASDVASGMAKITETAMPLRWVFKNISDQTDPERRDTNPDPDLGPMMTYWQETKRRFVESLGLGAGAEGVNPLPVQKNIWGNPIKLPAGLTTNTMSAFFGKKDDEMNFYDKELRRLGLDEPNFPGLLPPEEMALKIRMPDKTIRIGDMAGKMVTSKMTPWQYSDFIDYMNEPVNGKTMRGEVEKIIDSPKSDEMKKFLIKETIEAYQQIAAQKMMKQEYDLIEKLETVGKDRERLLKGID